MVKILDSLIRKSDSWARLLLTHEYVTVVGDNDREEASFEESTTETQTFFATEGESPDYNSDQKIKDWGDINQELKVFHVPSNITFNNFVHKGVRDRIKIEGYGDIEYEVWSVDVDRFWRQTNVTIYLRPLTP